MEQDCEQLNIDNNWSLTRLNACHIAIQNDEMGELRDAQIIMNGHMNSMAWKVDMILVVFGAIGLAILALVVKKMWGK